MCVLTLTAAANCKLLRVVSGSGGAGNRGEKRRWFVAQYGVLLFRYSGLSPLPPLRDDVSIPSF